MIVGSHNWTQKAEDTNDENTLIFHNYDLAQTFYSEFYGRWCEYRPENQKCSIDTTISDEEVTLMLTPNPASSDEVSVFFESNSAIQFEMEVIDISGRTIRNFSKELQPGQNRLTECNGLLPGQYIIQCRQPESMYTLRSTIAY